MKNKWFLFVATMPGLPHMAAAYPRATNTVPQALPAQPQQQQTTTEMAIPNDLIGCIIGRGGQKINEIRYSHAGVDHEFLGFPPSSAPENAFKV